MNEDNSLTYVQTGGLTAVMVIGTLTLLMIMHAKVVLLPNIRRRARQRELQKAELEGEGGTCKTVREFKRQQTMRLPINDRVAPKSPNKGNKGSG